MPIAAILSHQQNVAALTFVPFTLSAFRTSRVDQVSITPRVVDQADTSRIIEEP